MENIVPDFEPEVITLKEFSYKEGEISLYASLIMRDGTYELLTQKWPDKPEEKKYLFESNALDSFKWFIIDNVPFLEEHERNNNCPH